MTEMDISSRVRDINPAADNAVAYFEGGLNRTTVVATQMGKVAIRRPKSHEERAFTEAAVREEYRNIGASALGVDFRLRSLTEQQQFMDTMSGLGLSIPRVRTHDSENALVVDFIDGIPLDQYVRRDISLIDPAILNGVITHLVQAHSAGIVLGDRWVKNTIIQPDSSHQEIDFDIELQGDLQAIATFELSQTLYHLVHFARDRSYVSKIIAGVFINQPQLLAGYDQKKLRAFMNGQDVHFRGKYEQESELYEDIIPPSAYELNSMIEDIDMAWQEVDPLQITNSLPKVETGDNV